MPRCLWPVHGESESGAWGAVGRIIFVGDLLRIIIYIVLHITHIYMEQHCCRSTGVGGALAAPDSQLLPVVACCWLLRCCAVCVICDALQVYCPFFAGALQCQPYFHHRRA